jgi:hypothetical protein
MLPRRLGTSSVATLGTKTNRDCGQTPSSPASGHCLPDSCGGQGIASADMTTVYCVAIRSPSFSIPVQSERKPRAGFDPLGRPAASRYDFLTYSGLWLHDGNCRFCQRLGESSRLTNFHFRFCGDIGFFGYNFGRWFGKLYYRDHAFRFLSSHFASPRAKRGEKSQDGCSARGASRKGDTNQLKRLGAGWNVRCVGKCLYLQQIRPA